MITVIKEGSKEKYKFKKTCPVCGCEFDYELCDLHKDYDYSTCLTSYPPQYMYTRYVNCPCCHEKVIHDSGSDSGRDNHEEIIKPPYVTWNVNGELSVKDCETCPNRPDPNNPVFGDTPCTFCEQRMPKCK